MKLLGSRLEEQYRSELTRGNHALFSEKVNQRLLTSIRHSFPNMRVAFVLDWVPEQGEDIYTILINDACVAVFELPRSNKYIAEAQSIQSVKDYTKNIKKHRHLKLLIALDLVSKWPDGQW